MKQDITTIPISEVLEQTDGCFVCRMRKMLEKRALEYASGSAMMEPDVRIKMNDLGFCAYHFKKMDETSGRLPFGLVLKSHIEHIESKVSSGNMNAKKAEKAAYKCADINSTCFVCDKIEWAMSRMIKTFFKKYADERDLRNMFASQQFMCLPHYSLLLEEGKKELNKKTYEEFCSTAGDMLKKYLKTLEEDVTVFCNMFDYRNSGGDVDNSRGEGAISRAIEFLGGDFF